MNPAPPPPPEIAGEERPFIPPEARPAVVDELGRTAWQVAAALLAREARPS
jgi:hypothetical protein